MQYVAMVLVGCLVFCSSGPALATGMDAASRTRQRRNDDLSLEALQTLLQQQGEAIQRLQGQLTATQTQLTALRSSLPHSFMTVGFSVGFSQDTLTMTDHSVLKFDHVITNVGNGYDPITGIFTAPAAGLYTFYFSFMSVIGADHTYIAIDKHGTVLATAFANGNNADFDRGSTEVTTHLVAGDQVWVRQQAGLRVRGGGFTIFTGFLVQAD